MNGLFAKITTVALSFIGLFSLTGCHKKQVDKLAEKGSVIQEGLTVNPRSVVGYVGDVMPFYDNGEMNIFYLQDGRNTNRGFHPFALMTTKDYVHYKDYGEVIPFDDKYVDSVDWALGTGSIIKDEKDIYHAFYTGHNSNKNSGLKYKECIRHATSTDKITWVKSEEKLYGSSNDFRDPYVYYDKVEKTYNILITTNTFGIGKIVRYSSDSLDTPIDKWVDKGTFFINDAGTYNMECPTFIEYNGYYYLSFSEQGKHRVTHYRYKKNLTDEWKKPAIDYLDDEGFYAARLEKDDKDLYAFGWCGTKDGDFDLGEFNWAGNLVCHKLVQKNNGELYPVMIDSYKETFKTEVSYKLNNGNELSYMVFSGDKQNAYMVEKLSKNITRLNYKIKLNSLNGSCGISFNTQKDNELSNLVLELNFKDLEINFYNKANDFNNLGSKQLNMPCSFRTNSIIDVNILIDGEILTIYLNDRAMATRMYDMPLNNFSFYGNNADFTIEEMNFYE